jgi:hypothetical protein
MRLDELTGSSSFGIADNLNGIRAGYLHNKNLDLYIYINMVCGTQLIRWSLTTMPLVLMLIHVDHQN